LVEGGRLGWWVVSARDAEKGAQGAFESKRVVSLRCAEGAQRFTEKVKSVEKLGTTAHVPLRGADTHQGLVPVDASRGECPDWNIQ